jgi:formylglycine-generating enzyme required for sulfatase activity
MSGNVCEWCWDWYGTYTEGSQTNPLGFAFGSYRVHRGGGWHGSIGGYCRVAFRLGINPWYWYDDVGFRVVRSSVP